MIAVTWKVMRWTAEAKISHCEIDGRSRYPTVVVDREVGKHNGVSVRRFSGSGSDTLPISTARPRGTYTFQSAPLASSWEAFNHLQHRGYSLAPRDETRGLSSDVDRQLGGKTPGPQKVKA